MNPLHDEDMHAILGANVLNGTDRNCKFWTNKFREMSMPDGGHDRRSATACLARRAKMSDARRRAREERRRRRG